MCATGERIQAVTSGAAWPDSVTPDFCDADVAVARTQPRYDGQDEVREVEKLFLDSIDAAEHTIYIENQFLTCHKVAERLAQRMRERPDLEALVVVPQNHNSWLEARTMRNGRIRFMQILAEAGVGARVRLVYPEVTDGRHATDTMVHSKVMVVDDRLLRIGSANLNNRSMGTDTECDLAVEAASAAERRTILEVRNRLIADHCGVTPDDVVACLERTGSLAALADELGHNGHALRPVVDGEPIPGDLAGYIESVADPEQPIGADAFFEGVFGNGHRRRG